MQIIEIAGLAGSGKSTIGKLLGQENNVQYRLHFKWQNNVRRLLSHFPKCILLSIRMGISKQTWTRFNLFLYLEILLDNLTDLKDTHSSTLLLDQGPIYLHAYLTGRCNNNCRQSAINVWSRNHLERWSDILDQVVWLEASDDILLRRVIKREKTHYLKDVSKEEREMFFHKYRVAYKQILNDCSNTGIKILFLRTDELSVEDTVLIIRQSIVVDETC